MFDLNYISELLQALLLAILPVLAAAGVRWVVNEVAVQKVKLSNEQQIFVDNLAKVAVLAAEQFGLIEAAKDQYFDKKQFAINFVTEKLSEIGLTIDINYISNLIEAAVMEQFNHPQLKG